MDRSGFVTPRSDLGWVELKFGVRLKRLASEARERVTSRNPDQKATRDREKCRNETWMTLNEPGHSNLAFLVVNAIYVCILLSTSLFVLETIPEYEQNPDWEFIFFYSELVFVVMFTIEFVLRVWSTPQTTKEYFSQPLNVIDVVAILPFYVELILISTMGSQGMMGIDLRFLRAIRLVRMLKMGRYSTQLQFMAEGMVRSQKSFVLLCFMLVLGLVFFSSMIWIHERGSWDATKQCYVRPDEVHYSGCSPYESVPLGFWWAITTMTTVGYGATFPLSPAGKVLGGWAMLCGILCVALPTTVLSVEFSEVYAERASAIAGKKHTHETLQYSSKHQLQLYINCQEFDRVRRKLDEHLKYVKFVALNCAEEDSIPIDPTYSIFHKQSTTNLSRLKDLIRVETEGYIS